LRIKRNCFTEEFLVKRSKEYKGYLKRQNYNAALVDAQFEKDRSELLKKRIKPDKKVIPLVLDYNPILPDIQKIIKKHAYLLLSSPELIGIFPPKSIFPAYRRTKNLKELLAPPKLSSNTVANQNSEDAKGCFKCNKKRCDLCEHYLIPDVFSEIINVSKPIQICPYDVNT